MTLPGPTCPLCEATYENCHECGGTGSAALWKPEELRKHQTGGTGCWTWLGRSGEAEEAMKRFDEGLGLEARTWPSGIPVSPTPLDGRETAGEDV